MTQGQMHCLITHDNAEELVFLKMDFIFLSFESMGFIEEL